MTSRFEDKIGLVTGAGSGLGEAIATRLIADGATVIVADVSGAEEGVAHTLRMRAVARHLDVADLGSVEDLEQWIAATCGGLDILANNAGIGGTQAITHEYPVEVFDRVIAINVRGMFLVLQAGIRLMLPSGGGAVVNTASIGGFRATPYSVAYITSKGADVMMTRVAALEFATQGVQVNAVAPGVTKTALLDNSHSDVPAHSRRRSTAGTTRKAERHRQRRGVPG